MTDYNQTISHSVDMSIGIINDVSDLMMLREAIDGRIMDIGAETCELIMGCTNDMCAAINHAELPLWLDANVVGETDDGTPQIHYRVRPTGSDSIGAAWVSNVTYRDGSTFIVWDVCTPDGRTYSTSPICWDRVSTMLHVCAIVGIALTAY